MAEPVVAEQITFVPSKRGGRLLVLHGYMLSINYNRNGKTYWKCKQERNCHVTAITEFDNLLQHRGEHTHPADAALPQMQVLKHRAKVVARDEPHRPMKRVFAETFANVNIEDERQVDQLPTLKAMRSCLYRSRAKRLPPIPHTRAEVELAGEWTQTLDGRDFVLANDGVDDRLIIFGTVQNLRLLCHADTVFMDGTFKMAPEMFHQVYSLHVWHLGIMLPVAIALLPSKTTQTYTRMFRLLMATANRYGMQFQPTTICIDFEMAVIRAIHEVFPNSRIRGCLFHFSQALWRKLQNLGLTARYMEDEAFNRMVRRAAALPLVPPHQVDDVWMMAMNEVDDEAAQRFKDYVTTTWIDNMTAHFPMELWTQYDNIDGIRTNNHLEGWHCSINRLLRRPHPNVFALIEILKAEQRSTETEVHLLQAGRAPPVQRAAHRHITERLVHLKQMLLNGDINVHQYAGSVGGVLKLRD